MQWYERMNQALAYLEEHLEGEIDIAHAAQIACHSVSNFQRIFSIVADMPLSEYIRRRKLTLAAFALQNGGVKVVDLSLRYGYESPESFTRAFHALHGVTPSAAREEGVELKAFPRISFQLTVKGDVAMDYRIETKEAFAVYGIEEVFSTENGRHLKAVPDFWQEAWNDGRCGKLMQSANRSDGDRAGLCAVNAICGYRETEEGTFPYMLFAFVAEDCVTDGFLKVQVPAATWAVFKSDPHMKEETASVIQSLTKRIYTDWLPTSGYEKIDGYELELYYDMGDKDYVETWIRVMKKQ